MPEFEPVPLILVRMGMGAALPIPLPGTAIATRMVRPGRREVS
ncbi:hypothetical protein [Halomonas sp. LBP4]|nr:hypothetical protein [Halomonas sp. LBP4]